MQEYSEKEKQEYIEWIEKQRKAIADLAERLKVAYENADSEKYLEELEQMEKSNECCLHGRSLYSECGTCDELDRICFPRFCKCGKLAIGFVNHFGAKDDEFFCDEHSKGVENFESYEGD